MIRPRVPLQAPVPPPSEVAPVPLAPLAQAITDVSSPPGQVAPGPPVSVLASMQALGFAGGDAPAPAPAGVSAEVQTLAATLQARLDAVLAEAKRLNAALKALTE